MARLPENRWARWGIIGGLAVVVVASAGGVWAWQSFLSVPEIPYVPGEAVEEIEELEPEVEKRVEEEYEALNSYEDLDPNTLREILEEADARGRLIDKSYVTPNGSSPRLPDEMFDSYLMIGSDEAAGLADVIIYVLEPSDGTEPIVVSIPRDLYLRSPCTQQASRINANLHGCNDAVNGPTLLSLAVADFTGIEVDHFVMVDFDGFEDIVDTMGGVELCFAHPTRDRKSHLDVGAGCRLADGTTALAWVRSRHTQQLIDGAWVSVGASDFTRQDNQLDVLFELVQKLNGFDSVGSAMTVVGSLDDVLTLDSQWTFTEAIEVVWSHRSLEKSDVIRLELETSDYRTSTGAAVLLPDRRFGDILAEVYSG